MIPVFKRSLPIGSLALTLAASLVGDSLFAQNVREYDQDGLRYRETITIVQRPVYETAMKEEKRDVVHSTPVTTQQPATRTVYIPITEYKPQPVLQGRWNPFIEPYYEYRYVPVTRWETRQEAINVPTVRYETKTETQTVKVPVTTLRYANEEYVRREIIGRATGASPTGTGPASAAASTAMRNNYGGVSLQGPPPKH